MTRDELLIAYLADRDVPCPRCRYCLRGVEQTRCPECGLAIRLVVQVEGVRSADPDAERRHLRVYLARRNAFCPECRAPLRGHDGSDCPRCGAPLSLSGLKQAALGRSMAVEMRTSLLWFGAIAILILGVGSAIFFIWLAL